MGTLLCLSALCTVWSIMLLLYMAPCSDWVAVCFDSPALCSDWPELWHWVFIHRHVVLRGIFLVPVLFDTVFRLDSTVFWPAGQPAQCTDWWDQYSDWSAHCDRIRQMMLWLVGPVLWYVGTVIGFAGLVLWFGGGGCTTTNYGWLTTTSSPSQSQHDFTLLEKNLPDFAVCDWLRYCI